MWRLRAPARGCDSLVRFELPIHVKGMSVWVSVLTWSEVRQNRQREAGGGKCQYQCPKWSQTLYLIHL